MTLSCVSVAEEEEEKREGKKKRMLLESNPALARSRTRCSLASPFQGNLTNFERFYSVTMHVTRMQLLPVQYGLISALLLTNQIAQTKVVM